MLVLTDRRGYARCTDCGDNVLLETRHRCPAAAQVVYDPLGVAEKHTEGQSIPVHTRNEFPLALHAAEEKLRNTEQEVIRAFEKITALEKELEFCRRHHQS